MPKSVSKRITHQLIPEDWELAGKRGKLPQMQSNTADRKVFRGDRIGASHIAGEKTAQAIVLILLYSAPALWLVCTSGTDPDIWWHLATGKWILQHHTIPHTDPFSAYGLGRAWAAYSWAFEVPAAWLVAHLGFAGLLLLQIALVTAIFVALHRLVAISRLGLRLEDRQNRKQQPPPPALVRDTTVQSCMRSSGQTRLALWRNTMESQMCGCRKSARPFACRGLVAVTGRRREQ
jgi:hypothetical protein